MRENNSPDSSGFSPLPRVCVLATGLIGASVGMACKAYGAAEKVSVWSRRSSTRTEAEGQDWCDDIFATPEEAAESCNLIVICSPVENIIPLYRAILPSLQPGAIVTDTGSTKSRICHGAEAEGNSGGRFIGSHPMAGSEKTGMKHARADLFRNHPCFITPTEETNHGVVEKITQFWEALGAVTTVTPPEEHDRIVAHISHLPHLVASSICTFLSNKDPHWASHSGSGLMDTTRIAAGDPAIWKSIIETNMEEIRGALSQYQVELQRFQEVLAEGDMGEMVRFLNKGKVFREGLSR